MYKKIILCIIGMSGVGKDTVAKKFLERNKEFTKLVPVTTRPMRDGELDDEDYIFTDNDTFQSMIENNEIMEHRKYFVTKADGEKDIWFYGNKYPESTYSLMIGTLESYENMKKSCLPDNLEIYPVYLSITNKERLYRLINRENKMKNPNFREMIRRFYQDEIDFSEKRLDESAILTDSYDNVFVQLNVDSTVSAIEKYIKNKMFGNKEEK